MNLERSSERTLWGKALILAAVVAVALAAWRFWAGAGGIAFRGFQTARPTLDIVLTPALCALVASLLALVFSLRRFSGALATALLLLAFAAISFSFPTREIPAKSRRFLELTDLQGTIWTVPEWSASVPWGQGLSPAEPSKADLFWLPLSAALAAIDSRKWIPVFENNVAVIALRRHHRSEQNFARAVSYFQRMRLPFDSARGIELARVYAVKPSWVISFEERPGSRREQAAITDANFYLSRQLPARATDRLLEALDEFPGSPNLMVRLAQVQFSQGERREARKWIDVLDAMKLPDELVPSVQEIRYALYAAGEYPFQTQP